MTKLHTAHEWLVTNCESYERANRKYLSMLHSHHPKFSTGYTTYFSGDHALFAEIRQDESLGEDPKSKHTNGIFDQKQKDHWF